MKKKMRKWGTCALMVAMSATVTVSAADFAGKKYYVNPGHGGHDSDDRPTPLPLNVEMFYESDGNLTRGLFLRDMLEANGANVKMSRVTNYTSDDLALSTIASQSNSYGGYFISLHTNGANASANYIVSFFRTSSSAPSTESVAGSNAMATAVSKWHGNNHLTNMTYSTPRALGCYAFYGYNLGVLGPNNRPGYLVETVFHDYRPDGLRLKSDVYNRYTAWQVLMATREKSANSTGMTNDVKGCIIGDIRDLSKSCGYTNFTSRGRDSYLAVNGAKVVLKNSSGAQVQSMTTDNCANGLYGFFDLAAGTYTLEFSKTGYKTQTKTVTVSNNASTKLLIDLVQGTDEGISVNPGSCQFNNVTLSGDPLTDATAQAVSFNVTTSSVTSQISVTSSNPELFPVSVSSLPASGGSFTVRFKPVDAGNYSANITLKSGSYTTVVTVTGSAVNPPLAMSTGYNYGETSGTKPDWLPSGGWGLLRNMCFGDGHLYVVNASEGKIYVVEAQTCKFIKELNMSGVSEGTFKVMDVKYVNGKIIACNLAAKVDEPVKVYVWDNEDAAPRCILTTTERSGVSRLGDTFDIDGNLSSGRLLFAYGGTDGDNSRVFTYEIKDGTISTKPVSYTTNDDGGNVIKLGTSPRAVSETDGRFWIMGQQLQPTLIGASGKAETSMSLSSICNAIQGNDFKRFNYRGTPYALVTTYAAPGADGAASGETLTRGGTALIDCTNGWNDGELLQKYPPQGLGTTRNTNFSTSVDYNVNGEQGVEFWVLVSNQGLAYYKTGVAPDYNNTDPTLTTDTADTDFGSVRPGETATRKFSVSGRRLTGDISVKIVGDKDFSVTPATIGKDAASGDITVTYKPTSEGFHSATLTIATPGADDVTVGLYGQCVAEIKKSDRAHFAYNLTAEKGASDNYVINYRSTGDAAKAVLVVTNVDNPSEQYTEVMGPVTKGDNTYTFDASMLNTGNKYNWTVRVHNYAIETSSATPAISVGDARAAVATFTDPAFPEVYGYTVVGRAVNTGIDIYNPDGELVGNALHKNCTAFGGSGGTNPMDATTRGNEVYFACWNDKGYGVSAFDITKTSSAPYSVFEGTKDSDGMITASNGNKTGSGTPTVGIWGTGASTSIIVFDEDIFGNMLAKNVIGTGKTTNRALEVIGTGYKSQFQNTNVNVKAVENGFFATQIRGDGLDANVYSLAYISMPAGDLTWKFTDSFSDASVLPSTAGGVDVNRKGNLIAVSTYEDIRVFNLSWSASKPVLTPYATIANPFGRSTVQTIVKFDAADNIHAVNVKNGYFKVYLAHPENIVETTSPTSFLYTTSAVGNISVDGIEEDVRYYNLNGVLMPDGNLRPGVYIRVVGTSATKVIVR